VVPFPQVSPPKPCVYLSFPPYLLHAPPLHSYRFNHPNNIGSAVQISLCCFLHSPHTSSFLGPNILLYTLFSNTLSLHSSLIVSDQISHPHKTISCYGCCMDTLRPTCSSPLLLPVLQFISAPILVPFCRPTGYRKVSEYCKDHKDASIYACYAILQLTQNCVLQIGGR